MSLLYYLGIKVFCILAWIYSLFSDKASKFVHGRTKIFKELRERINPNDRIIWFHCASLGEFEQGRPLIEEIKSKYPDVKIVLTFFSPSGYEIRKNYQWADHVIYLPFDTPRNARKFLNIVQPEKVFFVKYEYWYFMLREIKKRQIPVYLVSAIFRKDQHFFKGYGRWFRNILHFFDYIFVQNTLSKDLLVSHNINSVAVTGDTRFDRVKKIAEKAKPLDLMEIFRGDSFLFVAGSTWPRDEEFLIRYFREHSHSFKLIIAPHEVDKGRINGIVEKFDEGEVMKYSRANESNIHEKKVLLVDSIGLLSSLYRYGDIAYIGGGFGKGIHNILEAATFGLPVIFGPNHTKFREALDLKKNGGAFAIEDYRSFCEVIDELLTNPEKLRESGQISKRYVDNKAGSTSRILNHIFEE